MLLFRVDLHDLPDDFRIQGTEVDYGVLHGGFPTPGPPISQVTAMTALRDRWPRRGYFFFEISRAIATVPVRTNSLMPMGFMSSTKAAIFFSSPVTSMVKVWGLESRTLPLKISASRRTSTLFSRFGATLMRIISRSTWSNSVRSTTLMTSMSLLSCFVICSITQSSPEVTIVMIEIWGSMVSPTERLSMLYPLPLKSPATLERTPNLFSTRTEIV